MAKYILFIAVVSSLWHRTLAFHECDRNITGTQIIFSCNLTTTELNLYDLTTAQLNSITSIIGKARDASSTRGPFTSIPPNICFLPNLRTVDFSNNQIVNIDPTESLTYCLNNVVELNVANNNITTFPSVLLYNMPNLKNLYFQYNQLTEVPSIAFYNISQLNIIDFSYNLLTSFELWALEVQTRADFRFNQISTITNKYFFTDFAQGTSSVQVLLSNNTATIDFTDAIYEMYDKCDELRIVLYDENFNGTIAGFTWKLTAINFGTTTVKCSCDQSCLLTAIEYVFGETSSDDPFGISQTTCFNDSSKHLMDRDGCLAGLNSTVNFTSVYPRLCKIYTDEEGQTINKTEIPDPTPNTTYPHYASALLNPGACFFRFTSSTSMTVVRCSSESTTASSQLSDSLLDDPYMQGITTIVFPSIISAFPTYFCSLPSGEINLNSNNFTTLTNATFPCLDSFNKITLSNNKLTSVNTPRINFQTLTYLDLSSNQLTELPYSILRPTPTSLRVLDLRNNSIGQLDLFIYTLKDIDVYLDDNPIDLTNLTNTQNVTIDANSTSSVNISLPASVANRSTIIQDSTVATLVSCATFTAIESSLSYLRSTTNAVLLCTCASFTLKQIYSENENDITESFSCSNSSQLESYLDLTTESCPNAVYIRRGPCNDTEMSNNTTPVGGFNTPTEYTSTTFTSNSSLTTLQPSNQTQSTTFSTNDTSFSSTTPGGNSNSTGVTIPSANDTSSSSTTSGGNSSSTGVTIPSANDTSSSSTISGGNSSSTGVTLSPGNGTSPTSTISGGNSSSTGVTIPSANDTSSTSTTSGSNSSSTGVTLSPGNGTSPTSTTLGGNSSSTGVTIPSTNGTSSSSTTPGGSSSSTGVTMPSENDTSPTSTIPGSNSSSTGVTLSPGNDTSSTSTTPGGNSSSTEVTSSSSTTSGSSSSSTGVTIPSGNETSSTNINIPGGNSSSTGTTSLISNNTSSASTTTPGGTLSSTGITTSLGNGTSSGSTTTPEGNSQTTTIHTGYVTVFTSTTSVVNATISISTTTSESTEFPSDSTTTLIPPVQTGRQADSDNTKLIIGLVVGLVGGALLIGALIATYFIFKSKKPPIKKPIRRANVNSQGPQDNLVNRVQPRNMRSVRLAPLPSISRPPLPNVPVKAFAPTNTMLTAYPSNVSRTSAKGIPVRLDAVRSPSDINPQYPPNSNALNNSSSFRPINHNNISTYQAQMPQQQTQTSAHQQLNIGGDLRT